jgi:hypothetical protein
MPPTEVLSRTVAAVLGGYALAYAFTAGTAGALVATGLTRSEAVVAASMLSFVIYLGAIIYAFGARSARRGWSWVGGGTGLFGVVALFVDLAR